MGVAGGVEVMVVVCWSLGILKGLGVLGSNDGRVGLGGEFTMEVVSPMASWTLCKFSLYLSCKRLLCLKMGCVFIH